MGKIPPLNDIPDFPVLKSGWYKLKVLGVQDKFDKNDDPYYQIEFNVIDRGEKKVWDRFWLNEDRVWKLKRFLKALGFSIEIEHDTNEFIDKEVRANIVPQKQGEQTYERITEYMDIAISPEEIPKIPEEEKEDLPF